MQASNDWEQWTEQEVTLIMFSCKWSRRRFVILMRETLERSEENVLVFVFVSLSFSLPCRCLGGGAGVGPVPLHTSLEQYGMNLRNRRQLLLLGWGLRPSDNDYQLRLQLSVTIQTRIHHCMVQVKPDQVRLKQERRERGSILLLVDRGTLCNLFKRQSCFKAALINIFKAPSLWSQVHTFKVSWVHLAQLWQYKNLVKH